MPSVFEFFGIKRQADYTLVPQLGIKNQPFELQRVSQTYFDINENAQAKDGDLMAVSIKMGQKFDVMNDVHLQFLQDCTNMFKQRSQPLQQLDQKIMMSALVGVIASSLSFLPFIGYFSLLGWGSALYYIQQRSLAVYEYQETLKLLVATCNWSLGQVSSSDIPTALTNNLTIRQMMVELYPVLTKMQIKHLIADSIEDIYIHELKQYEESMGFSSINNTFFNKQDDKISLSKKSTEFYRCVYGFHKGNSSDFVDAFVSLLPDLYNFAANGCAKIYNWWNKSPTQTQSALETQTM